MPAPIDNRTRLRGTVRGSHPHPEVERWTVLDLEVAHVDVVEGWPSLVDAAAGSVLAVAVDTAHLPGGSTPGPSSGPAAGDLRGWSLDARVRLAAPGVVVVVPDGAAEIVHPPCTP